RSRHRIGCSATTGYRERVRAIRRLLVRTVLPEPLEPLGELITNLRWSWHQPTQELFASIDPRGWDDVGHDPVRLLGEVSPERLTELASDQAFLGRVRAAHADLRQYLAEPRWYQDADGEAPAGIAYFSPEYGLTHVLPQYSGGLGILAGDHLKAASDLGVPIIGVGPLYRAGYFRQSLSLDGWQVEHYPVIDPDGLPLELVTDPSGRPALVDVAMPGGRRLHAQMWKASVGRAVLLLLDTDVDDNDDDLR